jgi:hypothetical protein
VNECVVSPNVLKVVEKPAKLRTTLDDFNDLQTRTAEAAPMPEVRSVQVENPGRTVRAPQNEVIFDREAMKIGECVCHSRA